jgi:hypothetical protein
MSSELSGLWPRETRGMVSLVCSVRCSDEERAGTNPSSFRGVRFNPSGRLVAFSLQLDRFHNGFCQVQFSPRAPCNFL